MHGLAELILSLCGLMEAEGRLLRDNVFLLTRRCVILVVGILFGTAALACIVAASYEVMLLVMPKPAAIALMGIICAVIGAALLWSVREKCEKKENPRTATQPPFQETVGTPRMKTRKMEKMPEGEKTDQELKKQNNDS